MVKILCEYIFCKHLIFSILFDMLFSNVVVENAKAPACRRGFLGDDNLSIQSIPSGNRIILHRLRCEEDRCRVVVL